MQATNLAQVADELYALAPAAFTAARDERANQARADGDAGLAAEIRKLRRPTVSAWLVNLLVREAPGQVGELLKLGESLRQAQQALDGDRLRDLSGQRRQLITAATQEAKKLAARAGQAVSAQVEREVQETLEAALAGPAIADAVGSGRLTKALAYAGLGEGIGESDAVAVWPPPVERPLQPGGRAAPSTARGRGTQAAPAKQRARREPAASQRSTREDRAAERERREAEAAERARQEAEAAERNRREAAEDVNEAQAGLDAAEREVAGARGQHEALQGRIEELERQLGQLQDESAERLRALRHAQRSRDIAARSLDGALRRLARAEAKASQHRI